MLNPELVVLTAQENISLKSKEDPAGSNKQPYGAMFDEHLKDWQWFNGRKNGFDWCTQFHDAMYVDTYGVETARKMLFRPKSSLAAVVKYSYNSFFRTQKGFHILVLLPVLIRHTFIQSRETPQARTI